MDKGGQHANTRTTGHSGRTSAGKAHPRQHDFDRGQHPQEQARKWAHHSERQVRAIEAALKADDELAIAHYDTMAREKISNLLNTRGNTP